MQPLPLEVQLLAVRPVGGRVDARHQFDKARVPGEAAGQVLRDQRPNDAVGAELLTPFRHGLPPSGPDRLADGADGDAWRQVSQGAVEAVEGSLVTGRHVDSRDARLLLTRPGRRREGHYVATRDGRARDSSPRPRLDVSPTGRVV